MEGSHSASQEVQPEPGRGHTTASREDGRGDFSLKSEQRQRCTGRKAQGGCQGFQSPSNHVYC